MLNARVGRISMLAVGSMLIVGMGATGAYADACRVRTPCRPRRRRWYTQAYENTEDGEYPVPEQSDVTGPQRAPFGTGSHQMTIGQSSVQTELYRTNDYDGVAVADITRLEYSTLRAPHGRRRRPSADLPAPQRRQRRRTARIDDQPVLLPGQQRDGRRTASGRTGTSPTATSTSTATTAGTDHAGGTTPRLTPTPPWSTTRTTLSHDGGAISLIAAVLAQHADPRRVLRRPRHRRRRRPGHAVRLRPQRRDQRRHRAPHRRPRPRAGLAAPGLRRRRST